MKKKTVSPANPPRSDEGDSPSRERPPLPQNTHELLDWIAEYADQIYVREAVGGKWGSYSLTQLPADTAIRHTLLFVHEWLDNGSVPVAFTGKSEGAK